MSLARTYPGWRGRCLLGQCGWGRPPGQCGTHRAARWMCTPDMVFGGVLVGSSPRQIVSDHSVCSLQRQGRRAASAVTVSCLASLEHEHTWLVLRHWLPTRASQHYSNRHHPCQSFLLCVAPPLAHLCVQGPRWTPISRDSNMLRPTNRHQTTTCQRYLQLFIVEKKNSVACRPDHVGIP